MENLIFILIVCCITFDFFVERLLQFLNDKWRRKPVPEEGQGIYEEAEYRRSQLYENDKSKFSAIVESFSFLLLIVVLFTNGFAFLDNFLRSFTDNTVYLSLLFFGIIGFISDILSTPFAVYNTFVIEARYGFNKTTPKTFVMDKLKSWLLSITIGAPLLAFMVWIFEMSGQNAWIYAWLGIAIIVIFFSFFYSSLIVPLFNKQTPLEEGELKEAINAFAEKASFKLKNVYVIDGSKRSAKANAYFTGFGSKKRIVLYDTLIQQLSIDELVAVLAHEIGHYKKKHVFKNMIISLFEMGIMLYVLSLFISLPVLSKAIGVEVHGFHTGLIAFGILYGFISGFLGIFMNMYSRYNEYEADKFCAQHYNAEALISGLKKLSVKNLSNLNPHPWYVFVNYSHPTLIQRIKSLKH